MTRLPPLPREDEIVLVTSVLGASASWLGHVYLREALTGGKTVVFVSFVRDWGFHSDGVRRTGIDLAQYAAKGQFVFVDGLTALFSPRAATGKDEVTAAAGINSVAAGIEKAMKRTETATGIRPLLLVENPDFLLAAIDSLGAVEMGDFVGGLRELAHSVIVMVNADSAFMHHPRTRLEVEHAAFVVSLGHHAAWTVGLRLLDTGVARDVSGVIRVTRGAGVMGEVEAEEKEVLYFVGDGTVEVFDRGQIRGQ